MISVNLGNRSYPIIVKNGVINSLSSYLNNSGEKWILISQDSIMQYYGDKLYDHLLGHGFKITKVSIKDGESSLLAFTFSFLLNALYE